MLFQGLRPLHRLPLAKGRLLEAAARRQLTDDVFATPLSVLSCATIR